MARELFGTDGIRGRALEWPLDQETLGRLGCALVQLLANGDPKPSFLIGGDTRSSTETLADWLTIGIQASGGTVTWGGILPTPAVSHLLRVGSCTAGIVISASHNPAEDNGVKVLTADGEKVSETLEELLEDELKRAPLRTGPGLPSIKPGLIERYREKVLGTFSEPRPLAGLHLVLDAANGAASGLADEILESLGATVTAIASSPDGHNINRNVGAASPAQLAEAVTRVGADGGLALDGDADRAILVDEKGRILDGDDLLLAWGRSLHAAGRLPGSKLVATVMSNFGLEKGLANEGIELLRCPVGDRAVWEMMAESGATLGGEQSGHIICSHLSVTGDGLLTGTHLLALAAASGRPLSALSGLQRLPQVLINVRVGRRRPFEEIPEVRSLVKSIESRLAGTGRLLLRYSGTEPLARVMLEGEDEGQIHTLAEELAEAIRKALPE
jgi:phosphoglucosamine mutase